MARMLKFIWHKMTNGMFPECPKCKKLMSKNHQLGGIAYKCFYCGNEIKDKDLIKNYTKKEILELVNK